jgi:hypothetical protein
MKCVTVLMAHSPRRAAPFRSLYFSIIAKLQGFGGVGGNPVWENPPPRHGDTEETKVGLPQIGAEKRR